MWSIPEMGENAICLIEGERNAGVYYNIYEYVKDTKKTELVR